MPTGELSLYKLEERYDALLNTADLVPDEQQEQFEIEFVTSELETKEKREDCVRFDILLEHQIGACEKEIQRLKIRKERFENLRRRFHRYIVNVIKSLGPDAKGRFKKLQALTATMSLRALPASVDVIDDDKVPPQYRRISLSMPLDLWHRLCDKHPELEMDMLSIRKAGLTVDKELVKKAIEAGNDVPGADLRISGHDHSLTIR